MSLDEIIKATIRETIREEVAAIIREAQAEQAKAWRGMEGEPYISHEECAKRLGATPDALYKMNIPFIKFGGKRRYLWSEVEEKIRGETEEVTPARTEITPTNAFKIGESIQHMAEVFERQRNDSLAWAGDNTYPTIKAVVEPMDDVETTRDNGKAVYFMQSVYGGPIKIGVANDPLLRMYDLEIGSPLPLRLLLVIEGGTSILEKRYHQNLAGERLHGEWFNNTHPLLDLLRKLLAKAEAPAEKSHSILERARTALPIQLRPRAGRRGA